MLNTNSNVQNFEPPISAITNETKPINAMGGCCNKEVLWQFYVGFIGENSIK